MSARDRDAEEALCNVVDALISICRADWAHLQIIDREADIFKIVARRGPPQACDDGNAEFPSAACQRALRRGEPYIVEDFGLLPRSALAGGVRALHAVAVRGRHGEVLGALSALFAAPRRLDARETQLLELLARQAAAILERDEADALRRLGLQAANAAAWRWSVKADALDWPREVCVLHGRVGADGPLRYSDWMDSIHPGDRPSADRSIRQAIAHRLHDVRIEYRIVSPTGELRWLAAIGKLDCGEDGAPLALAGVTLDITRRKHAEVLAQAGDAALRQSRERLRFAAEAGRLTFVDIDVRANIACRAENYAAVMGYAPITPLGGGDLTMGVASMLAHVAPPDRPRVQEAFRAALQDGVSGRSEFRLIGDAKGERWIEGAWTVTLGGDGKPERLFVTALDITELVVGRNALAEAKAEAERAVEAKSHFLATASHDLRQPVQSLILLLSVLERQVADQPKAMETARSMKNAMSGLQGLLTGVLDLSRFEAGALASQPARIDLGALLRRLGAEYAPVAAAKGLKIRIAPRDVRTRADPNMLERALRNLIENALRYTTKGGLVLGLRRRGFFARIDVIDTGIGVPEDKRSEIFEEFRQLANPGHNLGQGLGLGLAIVARLAKLMDATVEVASHFGRGSRFSLTLPVVEETGACAAEPAAVADTPGARILVVENDESIRPGLVAALEHWRYRVLGAQDGDEDIDLVICGDRLGAGRNGVETIQAIQARLGRSVPAIMLSGDAPAERVAEINALGIEVLNKPVMLEQLRRKIASMIVRGDDRPR